MAHTSTTLRLCIRSLLLNYRPHQCVITNLQNVKRGHLLFSNFTARELVPGIDASSPDSLLQNLVSANSVSKVLQVVERNHKEMNSQHTLQALKSIFELQKSGCSNVSKADLLGGLVFPTLCKKLKFQAREFDVNDTLVALKIITYMGVPTSSITVQILLQLIRNQVNDLSLQCIIFLDFLLNNMSSCPLVNALKIALPLVCESQLKTKLDTTDIHHVVDVLQYVSNQNSSSSSSISYLLQTLDRLDSSAMDVTSSKKLVWSMCRLRNIVTEYDKLLHSALQCLAKNIDALKFQEIDYTLHQLASKVKKKYDFFYHGEFVDNCGRYVIMQDSGLEKATQILYHLIRFDHVCIDLLDYIAQNLIKNPEVLEKMELRWIMTFVRGLSTGNYRPENWICIKEAILNFLSMHKERRLDLPWIRFVLDLIYLDCFSDALVEWIFSEDILNKIFATEFYLLDLLQLQTLHQVVFTLYPSYRGAQPPERILEEAASRNGGHMKDFPLQGALEVGLGGASYLETGVYTKLGHFIDHIVVLRKGGYPIAIHQAPREDSSTRIYVEELEIPPDGQIVMILCHPPSCYAVNCSRLKGYYTLIGKTLEALGYTVVHINLQKWTSIPDHEKIPYLMQDIKFQRNVQTNKAHALQ